MNEETQKQLLSWAKTAAEKGGGWLEQELPQFAAEIVAWHFWSNMFLLGIWLAIAAVPLGLAITILVVSRKWSWLSGGDPGDRLAATGVAAALLIAATLISSTSAGSYGYEAVKASVAPRVVILEYVRGAVK